MRSMFCRALCATVVLVTVCASPLPVLAQGKLAVRAPKFVDTGHVPPLTQTPSPRALWIEYMDVGVLLVALLLAAWIALKLRSRLWMVVLTLFSIFYFGFWRRGCVCPVGSVQNITSAFFDPTYVLPLTVAAFFALPLIFALFFGRVFCSSVCPLGALQEVVLFRHVPLPRWFNEAFGVVPYVYLGLAVMFAATGGGYVICEYDPFIGFYRMGATFPMISLGVVILVIGMFVGRPYCRFLCPYGVLLRWASHLSRWHVTVTPTECIQCRLCEEYACPYDQILAPTPEKPPESRGRGVQRLVVLAVLAPLLVIGGGWVGSRLAAPLSSHHKAVALAEDVGADAAGVKGDDAAVLDVTTFKATKRPAEELYSEATAVRGRMSGGGWMLGCFVGAVISGRLIALSVRRRRKDYEPHRGGCVSCTRCFRYCPKEHERLGKLGKGGSHA